MKRYVRHGQVAGWFLGMLWGGAGLAMGASLTLKMPASVWEGAGVMSNVATVQVDSVLSDDLTISLTSSDLTEATVPSSVTITAGHTNAAFNLTVVDDQDPDSARSVTIIAHAAGFNDGRASVIVNDNELHHFTWSVASSPKTATVPFLVTVAARNIANASIVNFARVAQLRATGYHGPVAMTPPNTGSFYSGQWSGSITLSQADSNVCLIASDSSGPTSSTSVFFNVEAHTTRRLTVSSLHGNGIPPVGTRDFLYGSNLVCFITNSPIERGMQQTQYVCKAGTVLSNAFEQVSSTNVTLTLTNNALLTWQWQTNYWLNLGTSGNGSVVGVTGWQSGGSSVPVTATPAAHWHFAQWSGDINGCRLAGNVITAVMNRARSLTANFAMDTNKLTVVSTYGGTFPGTVTTNWGTPLSEGVTNSPIERGVQQTQFVCVAGTVISNAVEQAGATNITLTLTNNAKLTWQWQTNYWLNLATNGNGTLSVATDTQRAGSVVPVTATPAAHWHFAQWSGDINGCRLAGNVITAVMNRARSLTANFAMDTNKLTVVSTYGGTFPGTVTTNWGTTLSEGVTNSPIERGVQQTQFVCVAGTVISNAVEQAGAANITLILTNNAKLTWQWQTNYWLNLATNGNGTVSVATDAQRAGSVVPVTATPAAHWHFTGWSGDTNGCTLVGNVITAVMNRTRSMTANFVMDTNTLTVVSAYGGTLPGTVTTNWYSLLSQYITNSPIERGVQQTQFVCVAGTVISNAVEQAGATNITLILTNNAKLTWQWQTNYWLNLITNGEGALSVATGWQGASSEVPVSATPATHWHFAGWSGDTNGCGLAGNVITAVMTRVRSLAGNFVMDTHNLTVVSAHGEALPGSVTTNWGTTLSQGVTNSPISCGTTQYVCTGWTLSGVNSASGASSGTQTNVTLQLTSDAVLTWNWATQYWWEASVDPRPPRRMPPAWMLPGTVQPPNGWLTAGSNFTATATANATEGWSFLRWTGTLSGQTKDLPVVMNGALAVTAHFGKPDLVCTVSGPTDIGPNQMVTYRITTRNIGLVASPQSTTETLVKGPSRVPFCHITLQPRQYTIPSLQPGASTNELYHFNVPSGAPQGAYSISATADSGTAVMESCETNNSARLNVILGP